MTADQIIDAALQQAGMPHGQVRRRSLGGGHGAHVESLQLKDGNHLVAKLATGALCARLTEEAAGLRAIAQTGAVCVPKVFAVTIADGAGVLLMDYVEPGRPSRTSWAQFGVELAAMHNTDVGKRYGFDMDNHLGATPQPNGWMDDWVDFNRVHRFEHQLRLARDEYLESGEAHRVELLCERLDHHLPRHPKPALLHGDLWSGNAMPTAGGRIAVIDPAVYIGDGWADVAMMQLFGGFPADCIDAYRNAIQDDDNIEQRIAVYQLYHVLNHINLFGRGYVSQALGILSTLGY